MFAEGKTMRRMTLTVTKYANRGRTAAVAIGIVALLAQPGFARETRHETFSSPEAATHALYLALQKQDERTLTTILGAEKDLVSGGDDALDKLERERFAQKYQEVHRLVSEPDGHTVLYIGAENWPFPIPLVAQNGAWRFDADAGRKEVLWRRIGQSEFIAIEACHALVASERKDDAKPPAEDADIPVAALLASVEKGKSPRLFHGYYFRMLASPGGPGAVNAAVSDGKPPGAAAFIAYPATYRSSGVMTFIVDEDDVVYEKDLGPDTAKLARAMTEYSPDPTWSVSDHEP
jgi:Protein of unknown function (DUF2950)